MNSKLNNLFFNILNDNSLEASFYELAEILVFYKCFMEACFTLESCARLTDKSNLKNIDDKIIEINTKHMCHSSYEHFGMLMNPVTHEFPIEYKKKREQKLVLTLDKYMALLHILMLIDTKKENITSLKKAAKKIEKFLHTRIEHATNKELANHVTSIKSLAEQNVF